MIYSICLLSSIGNILYYESERFIFNTITDKTCKSYCVRLHDNKDLAALLLPQCHCHPVLLMGEFSPEWIDIHRIDSTLFVFTLFGLTSAGLLYSKGGKKVNK